MAEIFDPFKKTPKAGGIVDPFSEGYEAPTLGGELAKGFGSGVDAMQQGLYGIAALAGKAAGVRGVEDFGRAGIERNRLEMEANAPVVGRLEDIGGVRDAALWASHGLGSLAPFMASSVATGGVGAIAGRALAGAAGRAGIAAAQRGALIGSGLGSVAQETGAIGAEQLETGDLDPARALAYGIPAGLLDLVGEARIIGKLAGKAAGTAAKPPGVVRDIATQMGIEGATEGAQTGLERAGARKEVFSPEGWSEMANAAALGALGGGVIGGAGRIAQSLTPSPEQAPPVAPEAPPQLGLPAPGDIPRPPSGGAYYEPAAGAQPAQKARQGETYYTEASVVPDALPLPAPAAQQAAPPSTQMGLDPAIGPITAAAARSVDSGATSVQTEARALPLLQGAVERQQEEGGEKKPVQQPAPTFNQRFPFPTAEAAQRYADAMAAAGRPASVTPHPTQHDKFAVVPAGLPAPIQGGANAVQKQGAASVLQHAPQGPGEAGRERGGVEQGQQGQAPAGAQAGAGQVEGVKTPGGVPQAGGVKSLPRVQVGPSADGWINQNAQQARDRSDGMGVTGEIEDLFAQGNTARQVVAALESKIASVPIEDRQGFIQGVRSTLGIPSRATAEGEAEFQGWKGARDARSVVDAAAHEAASSPTNDKVETTAQILAGNQKKGHIKVGPFDISVENPEGSTRTDKANTPPKWSREIVQAHYGYVRGTIGADKDHIDAFVKPGTTQDHTGPVYVIDQQNEAGKFDEHKVMIGYASKDEAVAAYSANYPDGWKVGPVTETTTEEFNRWARSGDTKRAFGEAAPFERFAGEDGMEARVFVLPAGGGYSVTLHDKESGETVSSVRKFPDGRMADAYEYAKSLVSAGKEAAPNAGAASKPELPSASAAHMTASDWTKAAGEWLIQQYPDAYDDAERAKVRSEGTDWIGHQDFLESALEDGKDISQAVLDDYRANGIEPDAKEWPLLAKKLSALDRRKDLDRRRRVDEMSREEMRRELLTSTLTGIGNRRAYEESQKLPIQVMADADSLKWVNDNMGHESGDKMLRAIGEAIAAETQNGFHLSGDEFVVQAKTHLEADAIMARVRSRLAEAVITIALPDGGTRTLKGIGLSYGKGPTVAEADSSLNENKAAREESGERSGRGSKPPGATEKPAERLEDQERGPAKEVMAADVASVSAEDFAAMIDKAVEKRKARTSETPQAPKEESAAAVKPEEFKVGDRVVSQHTGRHGVVTKVETYYTTSWPHGVRSRELYYTIKTDAGSVNHASHGKLDQETGPAPDVTPDIEFEGRMSEPAHVFDQIKSRKSGGDSYRASALRARLPAKKKDLMDRAKKYDAEAEAARSAFEEWAAKYPDEARKIRGEAPIEAAKPTSGKFILTESKHGKTGAKIWVVGMPERVSREEYLRLNGAAGKHGGHYSKWTKGFEFTTEQQARDFMAAESGESVAAAPPAVERPGLAKMQEAKAANEATRVPKAAPQTPQVPPIAGMAPIGAKAALKDAGQHAAEGVKAGFAGLDALFGRKGTLGSGPSFDEGTWAKAKPHFEAAFNEFVAAGKSLNEFVRHIIDVYNETVIPYLKRWHAEKTQGANNGTRTDADAVQGNGANSNADAGANDVQGAVGERGAGTGAEQPGQAVLGDDVAGERGRDASGPVDEPGTGVRQESGPDRAGKEGSDRGGNGDGTGVPAGTGSAVGDYRPAPGDLDRVGSWRDAAKRNLDILELIHRLDADKRAATPEEQALLAKFTGWGASELRQKLFITRQDRETKRPVLDPENYRVDPAWKPLIERAAEIMTPEELDTALASTQYAHYTSEPVVRSIWAALERMGFKGGKILEPGMGVGVFHQLAPDAIVKASRYTGIERESLTAAIARHLLPKQIVMLADYVKQKLPNGYFDIAVGNPPFAKTPILDDPAYSRYRFSLHDYFFAKTIDKVRPGGMMVFVTSRYTMDKNGDRARKYLAERADLIGAVRLPQTAFKANAGTEVVTDVLFLRKRAKDDVPGGQPWIGLKEVDADGEKALVNEYFADHPEMVLGKHSTKGTMYAHNSYTVLPAEGNIDELFQKAVETLPQNVYSEASATAGAERKTFDRDLNPKVQKDGSIYIGDDGALYRREQGAGRRLEEVKSLPPKKVAWIKGFVKLRDLMKQARYDQLTDGEWEKSLQALNRGYSAFVKEHGPINAFTEREKIDEDEDGNPRTRVYRNYKNGSLLGLDVEGPLVAALERIDSAGQIVKGSFLTGRSLRKPAAPQINSTQDALLVGLSDRGRLDLPYIAGLRGITVDEAIKELGDAIYRDPELGWQTRDEYLSGDVVKKLEEARVAAANDESYQRNVDALYKAQPAPLTARDVTVGIGSPWIPPSDIGQFADEIMGIDTDPTYNTTIGVWSVPGSTKRKARNTASEWGTDRKSPFEILEAALNNRSIVIRDVDSDKKTYFNAVASAAANEKVRKTKEAFSRWVWTDAGRAGRLLDDYNQRFNNIAPREFDGSFLRLPGLSMRWQESLHPHQKRAIWRQIQTGNTYLAHAVGSGKTMEMIIGAMEQRRLGLIQKPIFVVPNHMLEQFSNEFLDAYPGADIMVAGDTNFVGDQRRRFVAQAAANNPDAIIITHSAFGKIAPPAEATKKVLDNLVDELRTAMDDVEKDDRRTRSQIESRIEQLERRFGGRTSDEKADAVVTLDEMGVDHILVDEAHEFRKLDFVTNLNNVKGITPEGSKRALDLYIKVKALEAINPGRSHTFASGTPVTNTLGELYSIMRFMDEDALSEMGLRAFDSWASQFGEVASFDERNAAGKYEVVERFATFVNVPDLMSRVRQFMDVLTSNQLSGLVKRPAINGGEPRIVLSESSEGLRQYMDSLKERIEVSRKWKPSKEQPGNPDPLINIITDGRLAAIDLRFVTRAKMDPSSKLNKMLDEVIAIERRIKDAVYVDPLSGKADTIRGGAQIVFSALGFGEAVSAHRGFDVRKAITARLLEGGIRHEQIAWMSDYKSHARKEAMFRDMREGKIKVLFGSPKNMGTGLNVQRRLKALHYLAPPWYPADVEQPHGRILRQGNLNTEVDIKWYATKGTYDSTQWQMIARKARFIEQAMTGDRTVRRLDDISEASQYEQASALSSGDDRVIAYSRLLRDIESLENLERAHAQEQIEFRRRRDSYTYYINSNTKRKAELEKAVEAGGGTYVYSATSKATIGGITYEKFGEIGSAVLAAMKRVSEAWKPTKKGETVPIGTIGNGTMSWPLSVELEATKDKDAVTVSARPIVTVGPLKRPGHEFGAYREYSQQERVAVGDELFTKVYDIASELRDVNNKIASDQEEMAAVERRIGAPFERKQELVTKIAEAATMRAELVATGTQDPHAHEPAPAQQAVADVVDAPTTDEPPKFDLGASGAGMKRSAVLDAIKGIIGRWRNAPEVVVVQSVGDLPFKAPARARGAFYQGKVYLVADNIRSVEDAQFVLLHETAGHYGLELILGDALEQAMRSIYDSNANVREMADARIAQAAKNGLSYDIARATEEALADLAGQNKLGDVRGWRLLVAKIRAILRDLGFTIEMSDNDVAALLKRAADSLTDGAGRLAGVEGKYSLRNVTFSPAFRRWFEGSKVVERDGSPMVVYHGTRGDFSTFVKSVYGERFHFGTAKQANARIGMSPAAIREYKSGPIDHHEGANVMPVYLSIKNPIRLPDMDSWPSADRWLKRISEIPLDVRDEIRALIKDKARSQRFAFMRNVVELLESKGYDGIVYQNEHEAKGTRGRSWMAFRQEQIKSATANVGNFSPENPDIRFSLAGDYVEAGVNAVRDTLNNPKRFNWWHRTVGTQFHKAQAVPEFRPVFEAAQRYLQSVSKFAIDAADKAPSWLPRLAKFADVFSFGPRSADLAAVSRVIFDGTLNDRRPDAIALRNLTHKQRALYTEARAAIDLSIDQLAVSEMHKLAGDEDIDSARSGLQGRSLRDALGVLQSALSRQVEALTAAGDADAAARKEALIDQLEGVAERAEKLKAEGYAPLMRFGQYSVDVTHVEQGKDGRPTVVRDFFGMYETAREAGRAARMLAREFPQSRVSSGTMDDESWKLYRGLSLDSLALFAESTGMTKHHLFQEFYKTAVNSRSALTRLIRRKKISGFDEDMQRVLASFITSNARLASRNYHFGEMTKAAVNIPVGMGDVRAEASRLVEYVQNPIEEASGLRGLLFVNFLGGSVASALTNATQPIMMTLPFLSQFAGARAAGAALLNAAGIAAGRRPADAALRGALARASKEGITDPQELHQLYAESIRGLGSSMAVRRALRVWGSMFSLAESFNRKVTFAAAFRLASRMPAAELRRHGVATPFDFAVMAVEDTQGIYNRGNRPNWARGPIGATVFTFKQYSIAYLEFLKRLPAKEKAIALSLLVLAAGAQGLPGADDLEDIIDTIGQALGYNTNSKQAIREAAMNTLGRELGGLLLHGVSGLPGSPVDVQARFGMSNLMPGTGILLRSSPDKAREIAEVIGPVGGVYTQAAQGASSLLAGQYGQAAAAGLPVAIQNVMKGIDMAQSGYYKDAQGRKVVDTSGADAAFKAIGIQPKDVATAQRTAGDAAQSIAMARVVEGQIADRWARGIIDKDAEAVRKAVTELREWNSRNPDWPIRITPAQIKARVQAAMLSRDVRLLKGAPPEVRRAVYSTLQGA